MNDFPAKILFATDGSEGASAAARAAAALSNKTGSELHVVHVQPTTPLYSIATITMEGNVRLYEEGKQEAQRVLDAGSNSVEEAGAGVAGTHLREGRPDIEIVELAEEMGADLIVLGSRGLGGARRALMGSVSDSVVRHAHCPVLVVREEGPA
jgi:nucleotide-binding universal stress UspA family protein